MMADDSLGCQRSDNGQRLPADDHLKGVTNGRRCRCPDKCAELRQPEPPTPRHVAMSWAQCLKRVFRIEIEGCARCGGKLAIIASIEEPQVIAKIPGIHQETEPPARGRR